MSVIKCRFAEGVSGFYILPFIAYSWLHGDKELWLGWAFWLYTIKIGGSSKK